MGLDRNTPLKSNQPNHFTSWNSTLRPKAPDTGPSIWDDLEGWKDELERVEAENEDDPTVYGPYHQWIKEQPCWLHNHPDHECLGVVTGHHLKTVGSGGVDWRNEIPACVRLHDQVHVEGWSKIEVRYSVTLEDAERAAGWYADQYEDEHDGPPDHVTSD